MNNIALFQILVFTGAALLLPASKDARRARTMAFLCSVFASAVSLSALAVFTVQGSSQWWHVFPALVACITLLATGLSRLANTTPRTYASILLLSAFSNAYLLLPVNWLLCLPWLGSVLLACLETRQGSVKAARVFALYLGTSTILLMMASLAPRSSSYVLLFALALLIKEACFPFHTWFPNFVESAPMGVVVAFVSPQVGVLLHLKILSGHLSQTLHWELAALAIVTALWGAVLASVQTRLKRVLAYLFISQSGLVAFGLENSTTLGRAGALTAWLLTGLGMAAFAMSIEALQARRGGDISMLEKGRDFESTPALATSFMLSGLALVGLPGTLGFISEDLLVQGSVAEFSSLAYVLIIVTAINATTIMRSLFSVFSGPKCEVAVDLNPRERGSMSVVLGILFLLGLCPQVLLQWFGSQNL